MILFFLLTSTFFLYVVIDSRDQIADLYYVASEGGFSMGEEKQRFEEKTISPSGQNVLFWPVSEFSSMLGDVFIMRRTSCLEKCK